MIDISYLFRAKWRRLEQIELNATKNKAVYRSLFNSAKPKSLQQKSRVAKATRLKISVSVLMDYLKKVKEEGKQMEEVGRNDAC
jgi:hypothetical protein